jgi:hypothetical protein
MITEMTADELIAALAATPLPGGAFALPHFTIAEIQRRAGGGEADDRSGDVLLLRIPIDDGDAVIVGRRGSNGVVREGQLVLRPKHPD